MAGKGNPKTGGRAKGVTNKTTTDLKQMILNALDKAGGEDYLHKQSALNPGSFMALIGKVLPRDINATIDIGKELAARIKAAREQSGR